MAGTRAKNYVNGEWVAAKTDRYEAVENPATTEVLAEIPVSTRDDVAEAVAAAHKAFWSWRTTPPTSRTRYFFRLRELLEEHFEELAEICTLEHGKIIDESRGSVRRAIENIEVAIGMPALQMGYRAQDVSRGIDEEAIREPLGVFACLAPFNFPVMVPMWFWPYAVAAGNTYIVKPSSQAPLSQNKMFEMIDEAGFPPGVLSLVNGSHEVADALMEHPDVKGISFVGSTPVGRYVYTKSTGAGKRAQVQGGAKNCMVVMPDCNLAGTVSALMNSCFGNSGQRCLAGSVVVAVGDVYERLRDAFVAGAAGLKVGNGMDESVQMGPVISAKAKEKIVRYIDIGVAEGGELLLDGRRTIVPGFEKGHFVGPTIFDKVDPKATICREEIFGPVAAVVRVRDYEEALKIVDDTPFGNASCLFTQNGKVARDFSYRCHAGNIGINIGIAAPIAYFPFGGRRDSFFGDLHGQGLDAIDFFTDRKVVITRWF